MISQDNSSLASMGTGQLLDLFTLEDRGKALTDLRKNDDKPGSVKNILENLEELWDEKQYESEYDMSNFLQSLNK